MGRMFEQILIINIIGFGVAAVGLVLAILWGRIWGPVDRDTRMFLVKMFLAIWAAGNVLFFIMR